MLEPRKVIILPRKYMNTQYGGGGLPRLSEHLSYLRQSYSGNEAALTRKQFIRFQAKDPDAKLGQP